MKSGTNVPEYKGYTFVSDERLEGDSFAYKLNRGTHRLFVSPDIYNRLDDNFERHVKELKIRDVSKQDRLEFTNPVLQELKQYDLGLQLRQIEEKREQLAARGELQDVPVRVLITIPKLLTDVENAAPDFVDPELDKLKVSLVMKDVAGELLLSSGQEFTLQYEGYDIDRSLREYSLKTPMMQIELDSDQARALWLGAVEFHLKSDYERYLDYSVEVVHYRLQWLEEVAGSSEFVSLASAYKVFRPEVRGPVESYTEVEIREAAELIRQLSEQIDIQKKGAYVNMPVENERLEELVMVLGEALGYTIDRLPADLVEEEKEKGNPVSHMIALSS